MQRKTPQRLLSPLLVLLATSDAPDARAGGQVIDLAPIRNAKHKAAAGSHRAPSRPGTSRRSSPTWLKRPVPTPSETVHPRDQVYQSFLKVGSPADLARMLGPGARVQSRPRYTCLVTHPGENRHLQRLIEHYAKGPLRVCLVGEQTPANTIAGVYRYLSGAVLEKENLAAAAAGLLPFAASILVWNRDVPRNRTEFGGATHVETRSIAARHAEFKETLWATKRLAFPPEWDDPLVGCLYDGLSQLSAGRRKLMKLGKDIDTALRGLEHSKGHARAQQRQWQRYQEKIGRGETPSRSDKVSGCSAVAWSAEREGGGKTPPMVRVRVGQNDFRFQLDELPPHARSIVSLQNSYRNHMQGANLAEKGFADAVLQRIDLITSEFTSIKQQIDPMEAAARALLPKLRRW